LVSTKRTSSFEPAGATPRTQKSRAAKQGLPDWIKWLLFLLGGCVGFGLLAYLVSMAVSKLAGG
jgi:hypothetical protein